MKKLFAIISLIALAVTCVSCGNMDITGIGGFTFKTVHVCDHNGNCKDFTIKTWVDYANGIEVDTKEAGRIFLSEGTYILFEGDECPLCEGK